MVKKNRFRQFGDHGRTSTTLDP